MSKKNEVKAWCVKHPDGFLILDTTSLYKGELEEFFLHCYAYDTMRDAGEDGYSIVPVTITEIKDETS